MRRDFIIGLVAVLAVAAGVDWMLSNTSEKARADAIEEKEEIEDEVEALDSGGLVDALLNWVSED